MRTLSVSEIVALWERAAREHTLVRILHVLGANCAEHVQAPVPDEPDYAELARLDLGERNRRLMRSYAESFSSRLECESSCPQCNELFEFTMDLQRILAETSGDERLFQTETGGFTVRFRLPNTLDLMAVARSGDAVLGRAILFERCIVEAGRDGRPVKTSDLPASVMDHVAEQMSVCDPLAETRIRLECPECGATWRVMIDIAELLWSKIAARAKETVRAVHTLARAYAWSEADILAMSDTRRALYLSMVDG